MPSRFHGCFHGIIAGVLHNHPVSRNVNLNEGTSTFKNSSLPIQAEMTCLDVCPLASELSVVKSNIICTEEGCGKVFKASSALNMHLTKHHRNSCLAKRDANVTIRYFCPEQKCIYHVNASRHFTQMKYLKQHYLKVHSEKKFSCESCSKAFATQDLLKYHLLICGIKFTCSCGNSYSSYEALLTHSKRKQHTFDDRFKLGSKRSKMETGGDGTIKKDPYCFSVDMLQPVYILPKPVTDQIGSGVTVNMLATSPVPDLSPSCTAVVEDKSMQTDPVEPRRKKMAYFWKGGDKLVKRRASAQTQAGGTLKCVHLKKSAETQTMGDYILKKAMADANISIDDVSVSLPSAPRKRKSNSGTQTVHKIASRKCSKVNIKSIEPILEQGLDAMSLSPSESFCLKKDIGLPDLWIADKNTSSTQTGPHPLPADCFSRAPPMNSDLNLDMFIQESGLTSSNLQSIFEDNCLEDLSRENFESCNVTQTDQNLNHLFRRQSCDDESHSSFTMRTTSETQTTDDLADLDSLLQNHMWTQTSEDPLFSDLDFADIETQTAWPLYGDEESESVLVSAETQTAISSGTLSTSSSSIGQKHWSNEPSHIETQTCEEDLRDLIEELESV